MSDCAKCWNTPCMCGHEYRNWTKEAREKLALAALGIPKDIVSDSLFQRLFLLTPDRHPMSEVPPLSGPNDSEVIQAVSSPTPAVLPTISNLDKEMEAGKLGFGRFAQQEWKAPVRLATAGPLDCLPDSFLNESSFFTIASSVGLYVDQFEVKDGDRILVQHMEDER